MKAIGGFETENLLFCEVISDDAEAIFNEFSLKPQNSKYINWTIHKDINETQTFISDCIDAWLNNENYYYLVKTKAKNQVVGLISIKPTRSWRVHITCFIVENFVTTDYAVEVYTGIATLSFTNEKIKRLTYIEDVENVNAEKAMLKAGLEKEGVLKKFILCPNLSSEPRDAGIFAITR